MSERFRGFLPVVVDVETGGFNSKTDALLEIAAVFVDFGDGGILTRGETIRYHVKPFEGANMEPASLAVNGIDPHHPLRPAIDERDALQRLFREIRKAVRDNGCSRAVLVGHNAAFDLGFLNEAVKRTGIQSFRDFRVVYARVGDDYEVRMLDLGRTAGEWVEVLGGLEPGTEYVTGNSHLIKADIEKSGASHNH